MIAGVEIVEDKASRTAAPAKALQIANACMARGLRTRPVGSTLAFSPALSINEQEVDTIVDILGSAIDSVG